MSRLYYEPKFRPAGRATRMSEPPESSRSTGRASPRGAVEEFLQKVSQIVPSEVLAVFLAILGVARAAGETEGNRVLLVGFLCCLVATPLYLRKAAAADPPSSPKLAHLVLSTVGFVVWAYAIAGADLSRSYYDTTVAGVLPMLFMLFAGLIPLHR